MGVTPYSQWVLRILCFLTVFLPLARGGIHPWAFALVQLLVLAGWGLLILESLTLGTPLFRRDPLAGPLAGLLALAGISCAFSPYPAGEGLGILITHCGALGLVRYGLRSPRDRQLLVRTIICTGIFLSLFGLLKRFGLNPFGFWEYGELPYGPASLAATFNNHNQLAAYLEMSLPFCVVAFLDRELSGTGRVALAYGLLLMLTTLVLSLSRGGWLAAACGMAVLGLGLWRQRELSSRTLVGLGFSLVAGFFLLALAHTPAVERAATLSERQEAASIESRVLAWAGGLKMVQSAPLLGTGPGTFAQAFTRFQPPGLGVTFRQAHNDYLQAVTDLGLGVVPLGIWGGVLLIRARRSLRNRRYPRNLRLAALSALTALAVHSLFDFNFHIPANAFLALVAMGMALPRPGAGESRMSRSKI
ncbi:MAG: O-antigen ligase family protein [Desulfobacterales bacterium]|nr:O-antigen ligase family protein [Desulfobacterales bacterium]